MAGSVVGVCFHGRPSCVYCHHPAPVKRPRRRCAACGQFVKHSHRAPACGRCAGRGFLPLRLPLAS